MSYNHNVQFIKQINKEYDVTTGNTSTDDVVTFDGDAQVVDQGIRKQQFLYGGLNLYAKQVMTRNTADVEYDYILLDGVKYSVDMRQHMGHDMLYHVSR